MRRNIFVGSITFMIISFIFLSVAVAEGDSHHCKGMMSKSWPHSVSFKDMLLEKIFFLLANGEQMGLSEEQVSRLKDAKYKLKKSLLSTEAEIDIVSLDIQAKLSEEEIDLDTVNSLVDKQYKLKAQKGKILMEALADLKNILNLEQEEVLKDLWGEGYDGVKRMQLPHQCTEEGRGKSR